MMDIILEFIEVAIHCILYNRGLYPQGVFEKRIKYSVPVQMCLHPDVCRYISSVMDSLKLLLSKGQADRVAVVILQESTNIPVEKFVFELGNIGSNWMENDPHLFQAERALRGFLLKLNVCDALLKPSAADTTWTVHVYTQDSTLASVEEQMIIQDFPWAEADEVQTHMANSKMVPLKSTSSEVFEMQLYVEESSSAS